MGALSSRGLRPISQLVAKQPTEILDLTARSCPHVARFRYKAKKRHINLIKKIKKVASSKSELTTFFIPISKFESKTYSESF